MHEKPHGKLYKKPHDAARAVVITRPLAQALGMQKKLTAAGLEAIIFPLLEIHALDDNRALDAALAALETYALVAFVSPNAIDAAFARRPAWPVSVPLAVMGEGSRQALVGHGIDASITPVFFPTDTERTDSQTLLAVLDLPALAGRKVLILRGESGRELLADALRTAGVLVTQVAAYRRSAPVLDAAGAEYLRMLLETDCRWVITSSEALQILVSMVRQASPEGAGDSFVAKLLQKILVLPHSRIAETAQSLGFNNIIRTASGDERLLAALQFQHE